MGKQQGWFYWSHYKHIGADTSNFYLRCKGGHDE